MSAAPRPTAGGWTGGQLSLVRALFGALLAWHFAALLPWAAELYSDRGVLPDPPLWPGPDVFAPLDSPASVRALLAAGVALSLALAAGYRDRLAALGLWLLWAWFHGRNPLAADSGVAYVGWLLLLHAALPRAPYGSVAARGRTDPSGDWRFPPALFAAAWIVLGASYLYSGASKLLSPAWRDGSALEALLTGPLAQPGLARDALLALPDGALAVLGWLAVAAQLAFVPLALSRRLRPWVWSAHAGAHLLVLLLIDSPDASFGRLMLHLYAFAPAWVPPLAARGERVLFDGGCGLCHGFVRFLLAEEPRDGRGGELLRFAPLGGPTFEALVPERLRDALPETVLVVTEDGELLDRSRAALHALRRCGGTWRVLAFAAEVVPLALRDAAYDRVAVVRHRLFRTPDAACPLMPDSLRARYDP